VFFSIVNEHVYLSNNYINRYTKKIYTNTNATATQPEKPQNNLEVYITFKINHNLFNCRRLTYKNHNTIKMTSD